MLVNCNEWRQLHSWTFIAKDRSKDHILTKKPNCNQDSPNKKIPDVLTVTSCTSLDGGDAVFCKTELQ